MRVIDPWEEHCTECGEPECYRTCPKFVRAVTGRCARFERGIEWRRHGGKWVRVVRFKEWGKLELLWHGGMAGECVGRFFDWLDRRVGPIMAKVGVFKLWRSFRWRLGKWVANRRAPGEWRVVCRAETDCNLMASIAEEDGEIFRAPMDLKAGEVKSFRWSLPKISEGALLRIIVADGSRGEVEFRELELGEAKGIKAVAWDLDGTLWDGILAEDGLEGIRVKPEALAIIKSLDERGVVSSIVSKNDFALAMEALKVKGLEEYFVFPQISWGPKSMAIRTLAKEMNIGLDAIAFVDDTEHERLEVRAELPEVHVYERLTMEEVESWGVSRGAGSSRRRAYRDEMARREARDAEFGGDAEAFLKASGLEIEMAPVEGEAVERCRELVQRTNQLNLTARRYGEREFRALLEEAECVAVKAHDKYGDYGVVGFVARKGRHIVECCFSCRIAGKGVERRVLEAIAKGERLTADIVATDRNAKIRAIVEEFL